MGLTMNSSKDRNTFQKFKYLERKAQEGKTPENDEAVKAHVDLFDFEDHERKLRESSEKWRENNMEYDLRSSPWICQKAKDSKAYAQNLYAAMCNNSFQKLAVMPILKDLRWSCSWRYAGGIVADMIEHGDYIDWYCSGIKNDLTQEDLDKMNSQELEDYENIYKKYVRESHITEEIRRDLQLLGWVPIDEDD